MDVIGSQRWFFSHASVGANMVSGMSALHGATPSRYQLAISSVGYNSAELRANNPPGSTVRGTVYECNRGNPGWQAKWIILDNSVTTSGWRFGAVDVVMDKLCYIDPTANPSNYVTVLSGLEARYSNTVFVYMTMPVTTDEDADNRQRNQYNTYVRQFCAANAKLLFDIADIEAHDTNGVQASFTNAAVVYQKLWPGYTSDGGHLEALGQQRAGLGWYATAATLAVPEPLVMLCAAIGLLACRYQQSRH